MAEFPALPLFTDAFIADTEHLTDAEVGIYTRILLLMWRSPDCRIPHDAKWCARKFRRDIPTFEREILPILKEFCTSSGNWWTQKRLAKEFKWVREKSAKNTESINKRWEKERENKAHNDPAGGRVRGEDSRAQGNTMILNDMSLYERNTPNPTPPSLKKEPPLPPVIHRHEDGVLKNGNGEKKTGDISHRISEEAKDAAKLKAPGWDIYYLMGIYAEGIAKRGEPRDINKAFPAWVASYTKGKRP